MDPLPTEIRSEIVRRLETIEREEDVRILYACESGSRAWGFASKDSDYDVRFLYVHPRDWYLSIQGRRDVIERPIADDLDITGWDLPKALRLFRRSNPPLLEWLRSPFIYMEKGTSAHRLRELAAEHHSPRACAYHYGHMATDIHQDSLFGDEVVTKRYLYALRPLLAIRWIEAGKGVVPTEFDCLVDALVPTGNLRSAIGDLLERKKAGLERDRGPKIRVIHEFEPIGVLQN